MAYVGVANRELSEGSKSHLVLVAVAGAGAARPGPGVAVDGLRLVVHSARARRRASRRDVAS
eukprot:5544817-Prymnesium_polylepis.1